MDRTKLAVLTNLLGGYDETESAIDVPAELIQKAVEGDALTGYENALLETGFNRLYLEDDYGLDLEYHFGERANKFGDPTDEGTTTGNINTALAFLDRSDLQNDFRALVADGLIDTDQMAQGYGLFANLTTDFAQRVIGEIRESGGEVARRMFDAYLESADDFFNYDDSDFWKWFRDTFYSD